MPTKSKPKATSPAARRSAKIRKAKQEQRRQERQRTKQDGPQIIANSVFALTLQQKPGLEVYNKIGKNDRHIDDPSEDYFQMYNDLRDVFQRSTFLLTGERTQYDPLKSGLDIGVALWSIINGFKNNIMPKDFEVRIDRDDHHGYYFTIYKDCEFPDWWHAMEIGPVVEYLAANDHALHDLFICFISWLGSRLEIPFWYNGALGYADAIMDEQLDCWEDNMGRFDEDEKSLARYEKACDEYNSYNAGLVRLYQEFIQSVSPDPDELMRKISNFNSKNKLVAFMIKLMAFAKEPGCMADYDYYEMMDEESFEGLRFDQQVSIIWDWDDEHTIFEMETIDNEAQNFGVAAPIFHYHYTKHTKKLNNELYDHWVSWPMKFSRLWQEYRDIANDYKKQNKQPNGRKTRVAIQHI